MKGENFMKRIKEKFDDRDRILCITVPGGHQFYYQPVRSNKRYWLFNLEFGGSVFAYFRKYGCRVSEKGFSLTLREIYQFDDYHNPKLARLMNRIPGQVQYVLKYEVPGVEAVDASTPEKVTRVCKVHDFYDHEFAA